MPKPLRPLLCLACCMPHAETASVWPCRPLFDDWSVWAVTQMRFWIAVPLRVALTALAAVSLPTVRPIRPAGWTFPMASGVAWHQVHPLPGSPKLCTECQVGLPVCADEALITVCRWHALLLSACWATALHSPRAWTGRASHGAQACGKYRPVFPSDAGCWAGGLALQWGVGFALPMSIVWALERRSRRCFSAQAA